MPDLQEFFQFLRVYIVRWIIAVILCLICFRLSYWQWERHLEKVALVEVFSKRIKEEPLRLSAATLPFSRVLVEGEYDFENEVVIRNRRFNGVAGVFLLTPLKTTDGLYVLVNRGFIPLLAEREQFRSEKNVSFLGLAKESQGSSWFSLADGDTWEKVDIDGIQESLPYKILPFFVERLDGAPTESMVVSTASGREEIFNLTSSTVIKAGVEDISIYPVPAYSTTVPAGRHLGYVYEWIFIGLLIIAITWLMSRKAVSKKPESGLST